jgi:hypothetical protein
MALDKEVAHYWCKELANNISDFRKKGRLKPESKLTFISKQYASLFALVKINRGDAIMKGVPFLAFEQNQDSSELDLQEQSNIPADDM